MLTEWMGVRHAVFRMGPQRSKYRNGGVLLGRRVAAQCTENHLLVGGYFF